jgi:effector-binding domain-containing protein
MLRKILLSLLVVIVVFAAIGFFLPREVSVTRTAVVHAPAAYVFDEFNDLTRWGGWNYWNHLDTAMAITYGEKTQGVGAHYAWDGPINETGTITIMESKPAEKVRLEINFGGNPAIGTYTTEALGDSTEVTMNLTADMGLNPIGRWIGLFMQKEIDKAFAYSLNKLEEINQSKPRFTIPIAIEETPGFSYVGLMHTMDPRDADAVAAQTSRMFGELLGDLQRANVPLTGAPLCLYPRYTLESMDFVCAVPVTNNTKVPAKYKIAQVPPGLAAKAVHRGSYETLQTTHDQLVKFIPFSGYEEAGGPWEVYLTDPEIETDTTKWVTEVYYPVKKK